MLAILLLFVSVVALLHVAKVQTFVTKQLSSFLASELHTSIAISGVDIEFFSKVVLRGIYIEDLHGDTLLYANKLKARISLFDLRKHEINVGLIELNQAVIGLKRYKEDDAINIVKLLEQIKSGPKDSLSRPWNFFVENIFLIENNFTYKDFRYTGSTPCVNFDDVVVNHLNAHLEDIEIKGDSFFFNANEVSLKEKSGFTLNHLTALTKIGPDEMRFTRLKIKTPGTDLKGELTFSYADFGDFSEFISKVNFKSKFDRTTLDSKDIAYFARELIGLNKKIVFKGEIKGTVDNIKGKKMAIDCLDGTIFKGDVSLRGLPEVEETFIDLMVDELVTNKSDIESIPAYPFDKPGNISIPQNLGKLGTVKFKGKFTGFYNDFVAYGNLNTAIGFISSDINLKFDKDGIGSSYSGNVSASQFDVGKFWAQEKYMGEISFKAKITGTGFKIDQVNATLVGGISDFFVNSYHYKNILVDGNVAKKLFNGTLKIDDENVNLAFNGRIDFTKSLPVFDLSADINHAFLSHLNLSNRDTGSSLGCEASLNFSGNTIDNISGNLVFKNIKYNERGIRYEYEKISLVSVLDSNQKSIALKSDIADVAIKGNFRLSSVIGSTIQFLRKYIPALTFSGVTVGEPQSFTYSVDFKKTSGICDLFIPNLHIDSGSVLKGYFSSEYNIFNIQLNSDRLKYGFLDFTKINLIGLVEAKHLKFESKIAECSVHDSLTFNDVLFKGMTNKDSATFSLVIAKEDSFPNGLSLNMQALFYPDSRISFHILPSVIKLDHKNWAVDSLNYALIDSNGIDLSRFNFSCSDEKLDIKGLISKNENSVLEVDLVKFNTETFNKILKIYDIRIGGIADGITKFSSVLGHMKMESDMAVKDFSFFDDTLGNAFARATWNSDKHVIDIDGHVERKEIKCISVNGQYIFNPDNDSLAFNVQLIKFPVRTFNHYLKGIASKARGFLNADLNLYGTPKKPVIEGNGNFESTSFLIDYLNTRYSFADKFEIDDKHIGFNKVEVLDSRGNIARVTGNIYHNYLKDFFFNIVINAKNFECLNTNSSQNDIFYGHAFATGRVKISGDRDFVSMDISLKSEKGTTISLPLSNPVEVKNYGFLNFISNSKTGIPDEKLKIDLSGIELGFDLEVTPDAEIKLIFDEKIGDVITGRGNGNINMTIDPLGSFKIYGNYEIVSGNYLFTLQNLINKDFKIQKGGTLKWNGDPYDAQIRINAIYKLNAVLNPFIQDPESPINNKMYPVELHLNLSEKLFNPKIAFKLKIPDLDPSTESILTKYTKTESEINTQVFSLLLARRFIKPPELTNSPNATASNPVGENAAELLSSQVSQWISQISTDFDLGVNYRPGNQVSKDEFEVMVSTNILKDRVTIDGVVGVASNNQNASTGVVDFNIEYKVSPDGRLRIKAFNKTNNTTLNDLNPYTQGIGIFYRREFDSWGELFRKQKSKNQKKRIENSVKP